MRQSQNRCVTIAQILHKTEKEQSKENFLALLLTLFMGVFSRSREAKPRTPRSKADYDFYEIHFRYTKQKKNVYNTSALK